MLFGRAPILLNVFRWQGSLSHLQLNRRLPLFPCQKHHYSTWNESSIITDRKSKYQARSITLTNALEIPSILEQLKAENKHIAKASHPHIIAWRTTNPRAQGSKDNGEKGAGYRLLEAIERHNVEDVLVIVTRWYGGTPNGSLRFRHINNSALESLRIGKRIS